MSHRRIAALLGLFGGACWVLVGIGEVFVFSELTLTVLDALGWAGLLGAAGLGGSLLVHGGPAWLRPVVGLGTVAFVAVVGRIVRSSEAYWFETVVAGVVLLVCVLQLLREEEPGADPAPATARTPGRRAATGPAPSRRAEPAVTSGPTPTSAPAPPSVTAPAPTPSPTPGRCAAAAPKRRAEPAPKRRAEPQRRTQSRVASRKAERYRGKRRAD